MSELVKQEVEHRKALWHKLVASGGPSGVAPSLLRELGIYGGAQGVWVNKASTSKLTPEQTGITVGLLHTGSSYADDLSDDGVLYHYPKTNRPPGRDRAEVEATKAAARLGVPVFVITYPAPNSPSRNVHFGWIESWDDDMALFLISFSTQQPERAPQHVDESQPFELVEVKRGVTRTVAARLGQQRFKFRVLQRYGEQCCVCGLAIKETLDAAHIRPKEKSGSDDPRNGLVLCAVHHRAFDAGLFAIEPCTLQIRYRNSGPHAQDLRVTYQSLAHLPHKPHQDALSWAWQQWKRDSSDDS